MAKKTEPLRVKVSLRQLNSVIALADKHGYNNSEIIRAAIEYFTNTGCTNAFVAEWVSRSN